MSIVTPIKLTIYNLFEKKIVLLCCLVFDFFSLKYLVNKLQYLYLCKEIAEKVFGEKIRQKVAKIGKNRKVGNPIVFFVSKLLKCFFWEQTLATFQQISYKVVGLISCIDQI
jgi:hypothetical protein